MKFKNDSPIENILRKSAITLYIIITLVISNLNAQTSKDVSKEINLNMNNCCFIENKGQWPEDVLFMANTKSLRVWITTKSIIFEQFENVKMDELYINPKKIANSIELGFVNGKLNNIIKFKEIEMKMNFIKNNLIVNNVKLYKNIRINNIWKGIDFTAYFDGGEFRYDFIVNPKINPDEIKISINGTKSNKLINKELILETSLKDIVKKDLVFYQFNSENDKVIIDGNFHLQNNILGFNIEKFNNEKILIIDPIVKLEEVYLSGENSNDILTDLDIDSFDDAVFCGYTNSPTFPANLGSYVASYDIVIGSKDFINNTHNWITFIGGSSDDFSGQIDVSNDFIYLTGVTESFDYPLENENYTNLIGQRSNFLTVLDINGENLLYSSYLGNTTINKNASIKVCDNDIYLSGSAETDQITPFYEFKAIGNQLRTTNPSTSIGFVTCFNNIGSWQLSIKFSTLFGGYSTTEIRDLDIDTNNNIYLTGVTKSDNNSFFATHDSYDENNNLGTRRNYISKISYNTSNLTIDYNTFFGFLGSDTADGTNVVLNHNDTIYIGGYISIDSLPLKNSFDSIFNSINHEGFISAFKLNSQVENDLIYSSYFGSNEKSSINDFDFDEFCNTLIFVGSTNSELINYTGIIENGFTGDSSISNIMIGAVTINESYESTLKELCYLSDSLNLFGNAIKYSHTAKRIIAGGVLDNSSDFDIAMFNLSKSICLGEESCGCPETSAFWFSVFADYREGLCDTNQCYVTHYLSIPEFYNCYNIIDLSISIDSLVVLQNNRIWKSNFNSQNLDRCINSDEKYEITMKLYHTEYDKTPCDLNQSAFCNKIYPCFPDYVNINWSNQNFAKYHLPQCSDCEIEIKWVQRFAGGYQDFQILSIALTGEDCDLYSMDSIYKWIIGKFIADNYAQFYPQLGEIGCDYYQRVNIGGCFGVWEYYKFNNSTNIDTIKVWESCEDTTCCWQMLYVCRDSLNNVTITRDTINNYTSINCTQSQMYNQYGELLPCVFACDWNANLEGYFETTWPYLQKTIIFDNLKKSNVYGFQITSYTDYVNFKVRLNIECKIKVKIYDLLGNLVKTFEFNGKEGENNWIIDNQDLIFGVYFYTVENDNFILKSGKFLR